MSVSGKLFDSSQQVAQRPFITVDDPVVVPRREVFGRGLRGDIAAPRGTQTGPGEFPKVLSMKQVARIVPVVVVGHARLPAHVLSEHGKSHSRLRRCDQPRALSQLLNIQDVRSV